MKSNAVFRVRYIVVVKTLGVCCAIIKMRSRHLTMGLTGFYASGLLLLRSDFGLTKKLGVFFPLDGSVGN